MSTKTTFKRVALVAVAAMGFGMLSVVPSSATVHSFAADVLSVSATTSTATVGSTASITVTQAFIAGATVNGANDSMTVTASIYAAPAGAVVSELGQFVFTSGSNAGANVGTSAFSVHGIAANLYTEAKYTLKLTPLKAGTYVIKLTPASVGTDANALTIASVVQTWTITVGAAAEAGAPDITSTSVMSKGITAVSAGSASDAVRVPMAVGSAVAVIRVTPYVANVATTGSTIVTATITGPGTLGMNGSNSSAAASTGRSITYSGGAGDVFIYVWADGTSGTSTITYTMGAFTGTKTVYFYGAAASVTTTNRETVIDSGSGAASTGVLTATVKDANGNVVPGVTVYAVSGTTTVFASTSATTGSTGTATISVLGLTAGTSTLTVQNVATGSTATYSAAAVSVRAGDDLAQSVALTLDKATYAAGEAAVLTVTVKDAAGNLVASGTQDIFTAAGATSTRATGGASLPGASFVSAGSTYGVTTYKINAPTTQGAFTISATLGGDLLSAGSAVSVTATVLPSASETAAAAAIAAAADIASAAVDAAAEATDAANAATDAANAAAEAADAATAAAQDAADAIASLATAVAELMADLKAQISAQKAAITALTNLVIKIQKKVKA